MSSAQNIGDVMRLWAFSRLGVMGYRPDTYNSIVQLVVLALLCRIEFHLVVITYRLDFLDGSRGILYTNVMNMNAKVSKMFGSTR